MSPVAAELIQKLTKNLDDWVADRIRYPLFVERRRAIWVEIRSAGRVAEDEVLRSLRYDVGAARPE